MSLILSPLIFILAIIAFKKPLWGLCFLIIINCTYDFFTSIVVFALPGGGYMLISDLMIFALSLKAFQHILIHRNKPLGLMLFFFMSTWLLFCALLLLLSNNITINDLYRILFREAFYWLIPIVVFYLEAYEINNLFRFLFPLSIAICLLQFYFILYPNFTVLSQAYYQFKNYDNPETIVELSFISGLPRLYPRGAVLVQAMGALALILSYKNIEQLKIKRIIVVITCLLSIVFTFTLAGRANYIALFITVALFFVFLLKKNLGKAHFFLLLIILFATVLSGLIDFAFQKPIISGTVEKTINAFSDNSDYEQMTYGRMTDNINALNTILESPVIGVGKTNTGVKTLDTVGKDVHGILALALLGGIIAVFLFLLIIVKLLESIKEGISKKKNNVMVSVSSFALVPGFLLMLLNTAPLVINAHNLIPFGLFVGIILNREKNNV